MRILVALCLGLFLFPVAPASALEQRGTLILYKEPIYEFESARKGFCDGLFDVKSGENVSDMRDFRDYHCQGRYTLTLDGNAGRMVTLFGKFNFAKDWGYLIIVKKDNRKVWLIDLEDLPADRWVRRDGIDNTGAYEAFYHESAQFSQNVSSVKWGKWWQGATPNP